MQKTAKNIWEQHGILFSKYMLVGGANTLLYSAILYITLKFLNLPNFTAVAVTHLLSMCFHFYFNSSFTFKEFIHNRNRLKKYLAMSAFTYLLAAGLISLTQDMLALPTILSIGITSFIVAIAGYFISRYWVFV